MTLSDKIRLQREQATLKALALDALHGRSRFPELEADGADAALHGYPEASCPYNAAPIDAAGFVAPEPADYPAKRAAWLRGHRSLVASAHDTIAAQRAAREA